MLHHCNHASEQVVVARVATADCCTLVHESCESDVPAIVDVTKTVVVTNAHFVEEDFIEACATCHLLQWANVNARGFHVDNKAGEAFVLRQIPVSTADDFTDI